MAKGGILGSLFGGGSNGKDKKPAAGREQPAAKAYQPDKVVKETQVLRQDRGLYGKVFILSLVEFYDAIGGRSGRLAETLLTICETVFAEQMGPNDGYSVVGEDQYIFRFGGCDDQQSLVRAAKIIEEIGTKMLGDHFVKSGRFKALLTAVGLGDVTDTDGNIDAVKVSTAVGLARALPPEPPAPEDPKWVRLNYAGLAEGDRWTAVPSRRKDDVQWVSLDYKPKNQEVQWQTLERDKGGKKDEFQWQTLERDKSSKADSSLQWQALDHKKKDKDLDWHYLEVRESTQRRAALRPDGAAGSADRNAGSGPLHRAGGRRAG